MWKNIPNTFSKAKAAVAKDAFEVGWGAFGIKRPGVMASLARKLYEHTVQMPEEIYHPIRRRQMDMIAKSFPIFSAKNMMKVPPMDRVLLLDICLRNMKESGSGDPSENLLSDLSIGGLNKEVLRTMMSNPAFEHTSYNAYHTLYTMRALANKDVASAHKMPEDVRMMDGYTAMRQNREFNDHVAEGVAQIRDHIRSMVLNILEVEFPELSRAEIEGVKTKSQTSIAHQIADDYRRGDIGSDFKEFFLAAIPKADPQTIPDRLIESIVDDVSMEP